MNLERPAQSKHAGQGGESGSGRHRGVFPAKVPARKMLPQICTRRDRGDRMNKPSVVLTN